MYCRCCNREIPDDAIYCPHCGEPTKQIDGQEGESASYILEEYLEEKEDPALTVKKRREDATISIREVISQNLLLLSLIIVNSGYQVLMAILILEKHSFPRPGSLLAMMEIMGIIGCAVYSLSLSLYKKGIGGRRFLLVWKNALWIQAIMTFLHIAAYFMSGSIIEKRGVAILALAVATGIIVSGVASILFIRSIYHIASGQEDGSRAGFGSFLLQNALSVLICMVFGIFLFLVVTPVRFILSASAVQFNPSFVSDVVSGFILGFIEYLLIRQIIERSYYGKRESYENRAVSNSPTLSSVIEAVLALILIIVPSALWISLGSGRSFEDSAFDKLREEVVIGNAYLLEDDTDVALQHFEKGHAYLYGLSFLAGIEEDISKSILPDSRLTIDELMNKYKDDPFFGIVYLAKGGDPSVIENKLVTGEIGSEWYPSLLTYYGSLETLSEQQEQYVSEMSLYCINHGIWSTDEIDFVQLGQERASLKRKLYDYAEDLTTIQCLPILREYSRTGQVSENMVQNALALAEEHPDIITLQYIAYKTGCLYKVDSAEHYVRTMEAAARFDRLFETEISNDEQILAAEKKEIGLALMDCYSYEQAIGYLEESNRIKEDTELQVLLAECCMQIEQYGKSIEYSRAVLQKEPANDQALYQLCICSLKNGDINEAITAAGDLSKLTISDNSIELEQELYNCVQYMVISDDQRFTDYHYSVYNLLTAEQSTMIMQYPILYHFMEAVRTCFYVEDIQGVYTETEQILNQREDYVFSWYLRGAVNYSNKEYQRAYDCFKKAESLSDDIPVILYSLASTCDALEDYTTSYEYCLRILRMLPQQNHGEDRYGISFHTRNLFNKLSEKLGKG